MPTPKSPSKDAWKQRFRAPSIYYCQIAAHAPDRALVWTNQSGTRQFYATSLSTGEMRPVTSTPGGHTQLLHLSPDGKWCYYLQDQKGNEIGHYVRIPYEGGAPQDITPFMTPYPSMGFSISRDGSRIGFTTASPLGYTIYLMDAAADGSLSEPRKLYECRTISFGPLLTADGRVAVVMSSEKSGKNEFALLAFDAATGEKIGELWDGENTSVGMDLPSPVEGDCRLVGSSNRTGIERLFVWNPVSGERADLDLGVPGSHNPHDWSPDGKTLVGASMHEAAQTNYAIDLASGQARRLDTPPGNLRVMYVPGGSRLIGLWNDASHNTRLVELDPSTGAMTGTLLKVGDVPEGQELRSITFSSSDGQAIQGWLATPAGQPGPFPTIVEMHGGPAGVESNGFNPMAQAWVDRGFAFFAVNYRGSVTFGREFEQKIWQDLGHWEVEDLVAAREWLVENGVADPEGVFLTGWSYGGYLTLLALGKRPTLWAGGMAGIAIADWAIQWQDTADTLRGYQEALFGGTPQEVPDHYIKASPITYAHHVKAPVLIIQGKNDTRTPARPVQMYEERMKSLGKKIRVVWYDAGHAGGFADVEQGIQFQEMMMKFAEKAYKNLLDKRK